MYYTYFIKLERIGLDVALPWRTATEMSGEQVHKQCSTGTEQVESHSC
jgi:hypothetical protein